MVEFEEGGEFWVFLLGALMSALFLVAVLLESRKPPHKARFKHLFVEPPKRPRPKKPNKKPAASEQTKTIRAVASTYPNAPLCAPEPEWLEGVGEATVAKAAETLVAVAPLKTAYQKLYQRMGEIPASSGDFIVADILSRLCVEPGDRYPDFEMAMHMHAAFLFDLVSLCGTDVMNAKGGLLLHDMSGVGLYGMAFYLADAWAKGKTLQQYDAILVVPIEQIIKKTDKAPTSLADFFSLWDVTVDASVVHALKRPLIILSGCSERLKLYGRDKARLQALVDAWLVFTADYERVIISDAVTLPDYLAAVPIAHAMSVSLKPVHFGYTHCKGDKTHEVTGTVPMRLIEEAAKMASEQSLPHDKAGKVIRASEDYERAHAKAKAVGKDIERKAISVEHHYPLFETPQALLRFLLKAFDASSRDAVVIGDITTAPKWFAAAVTAHETRGYMSYCVNGSLMVRKGGTQYVANLGPIAQLSTSYVQLSLPAGTDVSAAQELAILPAILRELIALEGFDAFNGARIKREMGQIKSRLEREGKIARLTDKKALKRYKKLCALVGDNLEQSMLATLFASQSDEGAYSSIQESVNREVEYLADIPDETRAILTNTRISSCEALKLGLSAVMLAETHRTHVVRGAPSFLVTLCLLDLLQLADDPRVFMQQFFAHGGLDGARVDEFESALCVDVMYMLGGLHPLSQGNSYYQTAAKKKAYYGADWVEFKSHIILAEWLGYSLACDEALNPHLTGRVNTDLDAKSECFPDDHVDYDAWELNKSAPWIFHRLMRRAESLAFGIVLTPSVKSVVREQGSLNYTPNTIGLEKTIRTGLGYESFQAFKQQYGERAVDMANIMAGQYHSPIIRYEYAISYLLHKDYGMAISELEVLLAIDPEFYELNLFLAQCHVDLGERAPAKQALKAYFEKARVSDWHYPWGKWVRATMRRLPKEKGGPLAVARALPTQGLLRRPAATSATTRSAMPAPCGGAGASEARVPAARR